MNFSVKVILVRTPAIEGLKHLFDLFLQSLNQWGLVFDTEIGSLVEMIPLNGLPLPLPLELIIEEAGVGVLRLQFLSFQVDNLPQEVDILTPLDNQADNFLD